MVAEKGQAASANQKAEAAFWVSVYIIIVTWLMSHVHRRMARPIGPP